MKRHLLMVVAAVALAASSACKISRGERCNPLLFDNECEAGLACVYPTAATCGVSYCCAVDADGNVTDDDPNCQPDPSLVCAPDASSEPVDGGGAD